MKSLARTLAFALAIATFTPVFAAQNAPSDADSKNSPYQVTPVPAVSSAETYKTRMVPPSVNLTPFQLEPSGSNTARMVVFRSESDMTQADRDLAASAQPAIRADAALAGVEFDRGNWSYQQLECQALPGHLFLLYKGDNGTGDVSLLSAAIPRTGHGHVRLIPIQRRGFSLYSPAPVNAVTIGAFNRLRAGEHTTKQADWLATALCYAALTGAHPDTSPIQEKSSDASLTLSFPPTLEVGGDGESTVHFVDSAPAKPTQWALTFDSKGKLLKVTISAVALYAIKPVPPAPPQQTSTRDTR